MGGIGAARGGASADTSFLFKIPSNYNSSNTMCHRISLNVTYCGWEMTIASTSRTRTGLWNVWFGGDETDWAFTQFHLCNSQCVASALHRL
jgi:hypothetical protein